MTTFSRVVVYLSALCLFVSTMKAATPISVERLYGIASAEHHIDVYAEAPGGTDHDEFWGSDYDEDEYALSENFTSPIYADVDDGNAYAGGTESGAYMDVEAEAGYDETQRTMASASMDLRVHDEGAGYYAELSGSYDAIGEAHWKMPDSQTGNPWIQATIKIGGIGPQITSDAHTFMERVPAYGFVSAGDSYIWFNYYDDGTFDVYGYLYDLDGPHLINTHYTTAGATFTVREYISPGTEFVTQSWLDNQPDLYILNDDTVGPLGEYFTGYYAVWSDLKAYLGSP